MRAVGAVEPVESRQRIVVRGYELEDCAVVGGDAVDIGVVAVRRSVEVAGGVGDDRGRVVTVRAVEAVECRQRVGVPGFEPEDGAPIVCHRSPRSFHRDFPKHRR